VKARLIIGILVLGVIGVVLLAGSTYTLAEYEQALITRFGKIQGDTIKSAGLHFKAPFIDTVQRFDKRWLEWDGDRNQIPTGDKKYIWVDTYARWRIERPVQFYKRLRDEASAQSRLDDIIDGEIRNVVANHDLLELVRSSSREFELGRFGEALDIDPEEFAIKKGRDELRKLVLKKASQVTPEYGIELNDVRFKRVNYVESVQKKVFDRMVSERQRIAERFRSEGKGRAAEIRGRTQKELKQIESEAYEEAQKVRGDGDAKAAKVYAEAYKPNADFYEFMKSMETYRKTVDDKTMMVLSTDSELLGYLEDSQGGEGQ
jgi:membrane protease subunit HflC